MRQRPPRYGLLLVVLIASYLLSAFFSAGWISDSQVLLFTLAVLLAIRNTPMRRRHVRMVVGGGFLASVLMIVVGIHLGGSVGHGIAATWAGLMLLLAVVLIIRQILAQPAVTVQSIYGAISAYLVIGLMFATFYAAMWWLNGKEFFAQGSHTGGLSNFQYFSFTTLTTLGYGDLTAAKSAGRAVAMIEAMTGQIFLATLVAKLVAAFRPAAVLAREAATTNQTPHSPAAPAVPTDPADPASPAAPADSGPADPATPAAPTGQHPQDSSHLPRVSGMITSVISCFVLTQSV